MNTHRPALYFASFGCVIFIFLANADYALAQLPFTIQPADPSAKLVCPNTPQGYFLNQFDSLCYSIHIENGVGTTPLVINKTLSIIWADNGLPGRLVFRKRPGCTQIAPDSVAWPIFTKSLVFATGAATIIGQDSARYGRSDILEFKVEPLFFPMRGTADTVAVEVDNYQWSSTWDNPSIPFGKPREARVYVPTVKPCSVAVQGASLCPNTTTTPEKTLTIRRYVMAVHDTIDIYCGDTLPKHWTIFNYDGIPIPDSIYSVTYELPQGWEPAPVDWAKEWAIVVPSGYNGGTVRIKIQFNNHIEPTESTCYFNFLGREMLTFIDYQNDYQQFCAGEIDLRPYNDITDSIDYRWQITLIDSTQTMPVVTTEGTSHRLSIEPNAPLALCKIAVSITTSNTCYPPYYRELVAWLGLETPQILIDGAIFDINTRALLCPGIHQIEFASNLSTLDRVIWFDSTPFKGHEKNDRYILEIGLEDDGCANLPFIYDQYCSLRNFTGTLDFCRQISSACNNEAPEILLKPSLVTDALLNVAILPTPDESSGHAIKSIGLFDALGQQLSLTTVYAQEHTLPLHQYPAGTYWLRVDYGSGMTTKRFVKI